MARSNPAQVAFNSGELSPRMQARIDRPQYATGCYQLRNCIPDIAGPAIKRGGMRHVQAAKFGGQRVWLARFEMTASESYVLEFGHLYLRFYRNRAPLLNLGVPYEIATPWEESQLINDDGGFSLSFIQSGDVIYIAHQARSGFPNTSPRKLSRFGDTNWQLSVYNPAGGPFNTVGGTAVTVTYTGTATPGGIATVTAGGVIFSAGNVGQRFFIEQAATNGIQQWEAGKVVAAGAYRRVGIRIYNCIVAGTTGTVTPTHTQGDEPDGDPGARWQYVCPGYGWGVITAIGGGGTQATITVESTLPPSAALPSPGGGVVSTPTTNWAGGAWGDLNNVDRYPTHVAFYKDRLVWGRGLEIWMSVAGDYENMADRDPGGRQTTESAISIFIPSRRGSAMRWMEALESAMVIATGNDEWLVSPASRNEPLGPVNISVDPLGGVGSKQVPVLRLFDSIAFVQPSGKRIRDMRYSFQEGATSVDLTVLADHILGPGVVSMTFVREPYSLIAAVRSDGKLAVAMYYPEQEALGWSLWETDGEVKCVEAIPSPDGASTDLWLAVTRNPGGYRIERLQLPLADDQDMISSAFYVDSAVLVQPGVPLTTFPTAAPHLVGRTVNALGDGFLAKGIVVGPGGSITLPFAAFNLVAGLPYTAVVAGMDMESGADNGTAQNKHRRAHRMAVRLHRTLGGRAGSSLTKLETLRYLQPGQTPGDPRDLFTGDVDFAAPGGVEKVARSWFVHDDPTPAVVLGFFPHLNTDAQA